MTITTKIHMFQWAAVISLVLLVAIASWTMMRSSEDQAQIRTAYERYIDILTLSKRANRFSEQIAELILLGEETWPDYQSARNELREVFLGLENQIARNDEDAENIQIDSCIFCDPHRLTTLRVLFNDIEETVDEILLLMQQDNIQEATELFSQTIETQFDSEVEQLLTDAMRDEQQALSQTESQAASMRQRATLFFGAVVAFIILTTLITGFYIKRALVYPIASLIRGVQMIGKGDLDHRITNTGADELSGVAKRINEMAVQLKAQRDQLLLTHAFLEAEVQQRTEELTQANQRLTDLDRLRVRFLADISHELRTPLTVLLSEADVALRGERKQQQSYRDALERIRRKGEEMSRMVDDLLFLARAEADAIRFDNQRIFLRKIIESTLHDANILAGRNEITIDCTMPKDEILIEVDPQRLKQALMVLIVNAIQHSNKRSRITLDAYVSESSVTIQVKDSGPGVPKKDLPYVFERFYRSRNGNGNGSKKHTGSGIGLHIAKWIVEKHSGSLTLASDTGGTVVTLALPRLNG